MKIIIKESYEELSEEAAAIVAGALKNKPNLILGLASGETPIGTYKILIEKYQKGEIDFKDITTFNLDEYVGLASEHPRSYHSYMKNNFFSEVNLNPQNIFFPPTNPEEFGEFENKIKDLGGIDLQILGVGGDGHIAFDEPGSSFDSRTRIVTLREETIRDNAKLFNNNIDEVPHQGATMGLATIMEAKRLLLLAFGEKKAEVVSKALKGPITTEMPASILQKHPDLAVILDKDASSQL